MKVISGYLKGRNIIGFDIDGTRPTMDRVKESIFGSIQNYITDSTVLDLFAGSGNLGIEAISNGAQNCYFIDNNNVAIQTINKNIKKFNIEDKSIVLKLDYNKALEYFKDNNITFDIIFIDPPYNYRIIEKLINTIKEYKLLNSNGLLVLEFKYDKLSDNYDDYILKKKKKYGDKFVYIFRNL